MRTILRVVTAQVFCVLFASTANAGSGEPPPPTASVYETWLNAAPGRAAEVSAFEHYLADSGVGHVFETYQLLRTDTIWQSCGGQPFAVAPKSQWPHIVGTLRFIHDRIEPKTGPLDIVSGYRDPALNKCAGGAAHSSHRGFWALDLEPTSAIDRETMIATVCRVHSASGAAGHIGLGFYDGRRFHIDSDGFRRWGSDYHAATSPCNRGVS